MTPTSLPFALLAGFIRLSLASDPLIYELYHRLAAPTSPLEQLAWTSRGVITLSASTAAPSGFEATLSPVEHPQILKLPAGEEREGLRYEVAIVGGGEAQALPQAAGWEHGRSISKPLCSLNPPVYGPPLLAEEFAIHIINSTFPPVFLGLAWDPAKPCSDLEPQPVQIQGANKVLERVSRWKTEIFVKAALQLREPEVPFPPSAQQPAWSPDGTPIPPPPPEKTFLQKYWFYILPIVVLLLIGGGEEPEGRQGRRA